MRVPGGRRRHSFPGNASSIFEQEEGIARKWRMRPHPYHRSDLLSLFRWLMQQQQQTYYFGSVSCDRNRVCKLCVGGPPPIEMKSAGKSASMVPCMHMHAWSLSFYLININTPTYVLPPIDGHGNVVIVSGSHTSHIPCHDPGHDWRAGGGAARTYLQY